MIMRAILINAADGCLTETEIDGGLDAIQKAVGGYIEAAHRFANGDVIFVDEEGLLKDPPIDYGFTVLGGHQTFAGNGILCRSDEEGETVTAKTSLAQLALLVRFAVAVKTG